MVGLGITCGSLRREVGRMLGFDRDPSNWTTDETNDVWDILDAGLRTFYYPPRVEQQSTAYSWNFLRPIGAITLTPGVDDYDLPEDFADLDGCIYFVAAESAPKPIMRVNEAAILGYRQRLDYETSSYYPCYAAISALPGDTLGQQRYRLMVWPTPDIGYTLNFKYLARQQALRDDSAVPLGGEEHGETIRAAVMAAAELHLDDETGIHKTHFMECLLSSIDQDRRAASPTNLGYNADHSDYQSTTDDLDGSRRVSTLITYEKYPE